MDYESLQPYILPVLVVTYFAWRTLKFRQTRKQIPEMMKSGSIVVDVRTPGEYQAGSRPGSINIPLGELDRRASELDKTRPIILCCASGTRSGMALAILRKNGFKNVINAGPWTNTLE